MLHKDRTYQPQIKTMKMKLNILESITGRRNKISFGFFFFQKEAWNRFLKLFENIYLRKLGDFFLTGWYLNFGNVILGIDKPCVPLKGEVSRKFAVSFQNPKCVSVSRNHEIIVKFVINYHPSAIKLSISAFGQRQSRQVWIETWKMLG